MIIEDLNERIIVQLVLVISDGAKVLIETTKLSFPLSNLGRWLVNKMKIIRAILPKKLDSVNKMLLMEICYVAFWEATLGRAKALTARVENKCINLVIKSNVEFDIYVTNLRFPAQHHRFIRTAYEPNAHFPSNNVAQS